MRLRLCLWAALVAALATLLGPAATFAVVQIGDTVDEPAEFDSRTGKAAPTAAQRSAVAALGARATWNRFGTPATLSKRGKYLAKGVRGATAAAAARTWLAKKKAVFGLASTSNLVLDRDTQLAKSKGHAVSLRQKIGGLLTADAGLVTVGLTGSKAAGWKIAFASSSLTRSTALAPGEVTLSASQAWARAARSVGIDASASDVQTNKVARGWTHLGVTGLDSLQQAKLVAFPTPSHGVAPAYETLVIDKEADKASRVFVDARDGKLLARFGLVHNLAQGEAQAEAALAPVTFPFAGALPGTDGGCGSMHGPYAVGAGVRAFDGFAAATVPTNDIVLQLFFGPTLILSADTLLSPEQFHYEPVGGVPVGDYFVRVCEFPGGGGPVPPLTYEGTFTIDDTPPPPPYLARWGVFPANPPLGTASEYPWNRPSTDTRDAWCWVSSAGCADVVGNLASRAPWDYDLKIDAPTFTTKGNNAVTAESWTDPLLPSPTQFRPTSLARDYAFPWTDEWNLSGCNPNNFVPGVGYDISAAVTNLFVAHNRMHDWSYFLGFTERNWNGQDVNFGLTERRQQNDPVVGDAQAGATLGFAARNNANMITLPDGTSSITNMYLWQPQAGAFYPPCADGDFDMAVIGHEYGHMIENRMIGKGANRTGHHAGAMGESSGDLMAMEYLNEFGLVPTGSENQYSVGAYATGNQIRGIRNYGMNFPSSGGVPEVGEYPMINPLNFSDMGYDVTGPQVHADGEIWSATNFAIRKALISKYDQRFPPDDMELQAECAGGERPPQACPGNRRWIQLVFDSYLLMPTAPTMLQARDAQLAADLMRFGGANQKELWLEFARHGYGKNATSSNTTANTDTDPTPDFDPVGTTPASVRFVARNASGAAISARIFVGHYEGRVSPIADTNPATSGVNLDDTANFAPGRYEFIANAPGYGHVRFGQTFNSGKDRVVTIRFPTNFASSSQGATASGNASGSTPAAQAIQLGNLIDDTEATNWTAPGTLSAGNLSVAGTQVTIDLAGSSAQRVKFVNVSAMLGPGQSRFTALRGFEVWACNATAGADCAGVSGFTQIYTSPADAFPGDPPRPVAPALIIRTLINVKDADATHLRLLVRTSQCTGAPGFQGDQDNDPAPNADADCDSNIASAADSRTFVRAAEVQAFDSRPTITSAAG